MSKTIQVPKRPSHITIEYVWKLYNYRNCLISLIKTKPNPRKNKKQPPPPNPTVYSQFLLGTTNVKQDSWEAKGKLNLPALSPKAAGEVVALVRWPLLPCTGHSTPPQNSWRWLWDAQGALACGYGKITNIKATKLFRELTCGPNSCCHFHYRSPPWCSL